MFRKIKKIFLVSPLVTIKIIISRFSDYFRLPISLVVRTFWGDKMRVVLPDGVSAAIFCYGVYEKDLSEILTLFLKPGDVFIDVGAHYGYFTLLAAKLVGDQGEVHAFEPTPRTCALLRKNTKNKRNITVNDQAAWYQEGKIRFFDLGSRYPAGNSYKVRPLSAQEQKRFSIVEIEVSTISLDSYCSSKKINPSFIKLDAEQAEYFILQGMKKILQEQRPVISLETWGWIDAVDNYRQAISFLMKRGYVPNEIKNGRLIPYEPKEPYLFTNVIFIKK